MVPGRAYCVHAPFEKRRCDDEQALRRRVVDEIRIQPCDARDRHLAIDLLLVTIEARQRPKPMAPTDVEIEQFRRAFIDEHLVGSVRVPTLEQDRRAVDPRGPTGLTDHGESERSRRHRVRRDHHGVGALVPGDVGVAVHARGIRSATPCSVRSAVEIRRVVADEGQ